MNDPKGMAIIAAARADYLSESEGPFLTDAQIHRSSAEAIESLLTERGVMREALEKIADVPYGSSPNRWWRKIAREALVSDKQKP